MSWEPFLRDKLRKYQHGDICKHQILAAMSTYKDLRPSMQKFVHNDGRENELLSLDGTIPVNFRGSIYNIPVCIFLQETHPFIPPLVYVRPTSSMAIKTSKHVDSNGRVFLPYLTEWHHPRSNIPGLIQILCGIFAGEPPVYAKPAGYQAPPPPGYGRQPYPGYTPTSAASTQPYPAGPPRMPMPMPMPGGPGGPRPGYPSYPPTTGSGNTPYPSSGGMPTPYPHTSPGQPSYQPTPTPYPPTSGYPPVSQAAQMTNTHPQVAEKPQLQSQNSISEATIKASLLSAVEDKLRRKVKATFEQAQIELDQLNRTQQELKKGSEKLQVILGQLKKEQSDVENNIKILAQKNEEISGVITKLESDSDKLQIDEAVVTTAPLYNQILNLFAEENAIEDTIYYLSEALRKEAVDGDVFLKQVRTLSRKQFMIRAILQKARRTAGLSDIAGS